MFDDTAEMSEEDQTEAVIDHLDVIGAVPPFLPRRLVYENKRPQCRSTGGNCVELDECRKLYRYVCHNAHTVGA